jgi:hypothetical protein
MYHRPARNRNREIGFSPGPFSSGIPLIEQDRNADVQAIGYREVGEGVAVEVGEDHTSGEGTYRNGNRRVVVTFTAPAIARMPLR